MGSIRCGGCKSYHPTVAAVWDCCLGKNGTPLPTVDQWARATPAQAQGTSAPAPGYYAVDFEGQLRFFKIEVGKGKWDGYTFLKEQASDELYSVRTPRRREAVFAAITAEGPGVCQSRYAQELVRCYKCGRTLTDELSRQLGIGPTCRDK